MYYNTYCNKDTHVLVRFFEEVVTSIVSIQHIKHKESLKHGGSCHVILSNKKYSKFFWFAQVCMWIIVVLYH